MKKIAATAAVLALAATGCASTSTGPDMVAVHYQGGTFQSKSFLGCVPTSTRDWGGFGDGYYQYPASQRNFVFDVEGKSRDAGPITFVTADGIEMTVTGNVNFELATDCDTLRTFHEQIGARYGAYFTSETEAPQGWGQVLDIYVGQPLNTAVDRAGQDFTYAALYNDAQAKAAWEAKVIDLLPDLVNRQTDGDSEFFTGWAVTLQKPEPPASIKDALVEQQAAVAKSEAQKAQAEADVATAEAQARVEAQRATEADPWISRLGVEGYLRREAIESGLNPFQPNGAIVDAAP